LSVDEDILLCEVCYDKIDRKKRQNYEFVAAAEIDLEEAAANDPIQLKGKVNDEVLDKLVEEYYNLDFEDVIAGGLKTRFKV
jgi:protein KRI1